MDIKITNVNKGVGTGKGKDKRISEWVTISVTKDCNLKDYILFDTTYTKDKKVSNENRHSYRFPSLDVKVGDTVYVNTGEGKDQKVRAGTYDLYWGLDEHVWNNDGDCALLVKIAESSNFKVP